MKYTIVIEKETLDAEKICSGGEQITQSKLELDFFEIEALRYVYNGTYEGKSAVAKFQQVLLESNNRNLLETRRCRDKFKYDIALIEVVMDTETAIQYIQTVKFTLTDKLANFGKL